MIHHQDDHLTIHIGDCREVMRTLPAESIHTVVTSPPYWGLRDYGVEGALGLEATPEAFIAAMVDVFREVRRVLRNDGTLWLNMGDSYASGGENRNGKGGSGLNSNPAADVPMKAVTRSIAPGFKPKNLVGMPWRLAFALQADGWYLRSDIIWSKPNPMPESVTDRPTKAHEYVFLLTKQARYYYDAEAVREPAEYGRSQMVSRSNGNGWDHRTTESKTVTPGNGEGGRNLRSVWSIATEPYPGAHFATFPQKLVEPCIKAGASERGVCPACGAPWRRQMVRATVVDRPGRVQGRSGDAERHGPDGRDGDRRSLLTFTAYWAPPGCGHDEFEPVPATVLDPFAGSGTTGLVANRLGRRAILIDLSADYIDQAMLRNQQHPLGLIG